MDSIKSFFARNDQFAKHNGLELLEVSQGWAKVGMQVEKHHLNGVNTVHGGALFTLADFAFAVASNSHGTVAMGINVNISFINPAFGGRLYAEAKEVSLNNKLANYSVEIKNDENQLIAVFHGMAYRKKDKLDL